MKFTSHRKQNFIFSMRLEIEESFLVDKVTYYVIFMSEVMVDTLTFDLVIQIIILWLIVFKANVS